MLWILLPPLAVIREPSAVLSWWLGRALSRRTCGQRQGWGRHLQVRGGVLRGLYPEVLMAVAVGVDGLEQQGRVAEILEGFGVQDL